MNKQNQQIQKMGTGMTAIAWILALLIMTWLFSDLLEKQQNPNQHLAHSLGNTADNAVTLQRNRQGHYLAPGKINNKVVNFLLDTGATDVAIPGPLARKLQLDLTSQGISQTASGYVKTYGTRLDSVSIGNITLNNVKASVIETMPGDYILLGMSFLKHLELVQKGDLLTIRL